MVEEVIISIILAYLGAQVPKMIKNYRERGRFELSAMLQNGGMPSSHTSTTVALTTAIYIDWGLSHLFIACALFTMIVMNDAMRVRRETGEEAKVLNKLIEKDHLTFKRLTEVVGHTPLQVAVGFVVGVVSALIVYAF